MLWFVGSFSFLMSLNFFLLFETSKSYAAGKALRMQGHCITELPLLNRQQRKEMRSEAVEILQQKISMSPELWADSQIRNRLIDIHLPVIAQVARRLHKTLPRDSVSLDDLASEGVFGLLDCIDSFDLSRGVHMDTFCSHRIRGSMLDYLRETDWVPRMVRKRSHDYDEVRRKLRIELGRSPTRDEIMAKGVNDLGWKAQALDDYGDPVLETSISRVVAETDSGRSVTISDQVKDRRSTDSSRDHQRRDLLDGLLKGLTRSERLILSLYYYKDMTLKDIGQALDLSESRVSQMHTSLLQRIKSRWGHRVDEFLEMSGLK